MHKSLADEIKSGAVKGLLAVTLPTLLLMAYVALPLWSWLIVVPASWAAAWVWRDLAATVVPQRPKTTGGFDGGLSSDTGNRKHWRGP